MQSYTFIFLFLEIKVFKIKAIKTFPHNQKLLKIQEYKPILSS